MVYKIGFLIAMAATLLGAVTNQEIKTIKNNPSAANIIRIR
jgi:hypothetical protein